MQPSRLSPHRFSWLVLLLLFTSSGCLVQQPTSQPVQLAAFVTATPVVEADQAVAAQPAEESTALNAAPPAIIPFAPTASPLPASGDAAGAVVAFQRVAPAGTPASVALYDMTAGVSAPVASTGAMVQYEPVTAGMTDDNEKWTDYLAYRTRHPGLWVKERDISERYIIRVVDEHSLPVHDAQVEIFIADQPLFAGRTDAGGQLLFHPRALDSGYWQRQATTYRVKATKGWVAQSQTFARTHGQVSGQTGSEQWTLTLTDPARRATAQLDLLFLIDATGSMSDEIDKLKASMADVADQIAHLPEQPNVRYGLVAYRDRGDAFVVQPYDFTPDLNQFQQTLAALRADGGGDTPEALNEALHRSIHALHWRNEDTVRMILLVADAPPHLDYGDEAFSYDTDMIEAVRRGVKIFPVGASGLEADGEYIFRQLAQFTGGKFVFLTYADGSNPGSGPGTETEHDVNNYSVDTLDRLVVRLVREELAKLVRVMTGGQTPLAPQPSPLPTPTATPQPQSFSCTLDLVTGSQDCERNGAIRLLQFSGSQALYQITLEPQTTGYGRARFDITYGHTPRGWSVNIGDSNTNDGDGGDGGQQSNDAELQLADGNLQLYGNDDTPASATTDGHRLLLTRNDAVRAGETLTLEVANGHLGISAAGGIEVIDSPYLFALNGQVDHEGTVNDTIYAAFNRVIAGERGGGGVTHVVITLYPAP